MTVFTTRRLPKGSNIRLVGRDPNDYAQELQELLEALIDSVVGAVPGGFNEVQPETLDPNAAASAGNESDGWASATHVHAINLLLSVAGELLTHNGSDYIALDAPTADDLVLTSDLAEPSKMKWAAAAGGGGWTDDGSVVRLTDSADKVSIGLDAPLTIGGLSPRLFVSDTVGEVGQAWAHYEGTTAEFGAGIILLRRRSGWTVLNVEDAIGILSFVGADGVTGSEGARIMGEVDGSPGSADMPGRLTFWTTPDGSAVVVERMRISSVGHVSIGGLVPESILHLDGGADTEFTADQYNDGAGGPGFFFRKARGSKGSETEVVANDRLFVINGIGWRDSGAFSGNAVSVRGVALESFTAAASGTEYQVMTNEVGSNTSAIRQRVNNTGLMSGTGSPHSRLQAEGPLALAYVSTAVDLTLDNTHSTVAVDTSGGNRVITLPTAVGIAGRLYVVKRITAGANTLTVQGTGGETIDGAASESLPTQWAVLRVQSDGANWLIV